MKVIIVKGNKKSFDNIIKDVLHRISLEQVVQISDGTRLCLINPDDITFSQGNPSIIAYTNSYSSITEGGIQTLSSIILPLFDKIDCIYLQNPPKSMEESILRDSNFECEIEPIPFENINIDVIKIMKNSINERIVGQDQAKQDVLVSLYKKVKSNSSKPLVLMLYGPSGVGKTETAKYIAKIMTGTKDIFRKQMSMLSSSESLIYMFGGKHSEITFSKELLERKTNVILLDEFDKCNPIFYSSFYQMFDESCFEDRNYNVNLDNAIIICTSNFQDEKEIREAVGDPIFFRFDKLIKYESLSIDDQKLIINLIVEKQYENLSKKEKALFPIENRINSYEKLLIGKLKNFRQAESIITNHIWKELYNSDDDLN